MFFKIINVETIYREKNKLVKLEVTFEKKISSLNN